MEEVGEGTNRPWVLGAVVCEAVQLETAEDWFEPAPHSYPIFFF